MTAQDLAKLLLLLLMLAPLLVGYFLTKRQWYVRFDRNGYGHYDDDPILISAHTFEGAKRIAKRMCKKNDWGGFKLRTY